MSGSTMFSSKYPNKYIQRYTGCTRYVQNTRRRQPGPATSRGPRSGPAARRLVFCTSLVYLVYSWIYLDIFGVVVFKVVVLGVVHKLINYYSYYSKNYRLDLVELPPKVLVHTLAALAIPGSNPGDPGSNLKIHGTGHSKCLGQVLCIR